GPSRATALVRLAEAGVAEMKAAGCNTLVMRDMRPDQEVASVLTGQGFVPVPLIESYVLHLDWRGEDAFMARLPGTTRRRYFRAIREQSELFDVEIWDERTHVDDSVIEHMHHLYVNLARKNLRINVFILPPELLRAQLASGSWEFIVLKL